MLNILIVEDSVSAQKKLQSILCPYAKCTLAANGAQAINIVEKSFKAGKHFDLIVMDVIMPELDGLSAAKEIRELEEKYDIQPANRQTIIILTVVKKPANILQAQYQCGADAYIAKPYTQDNVLETINNCGFDLISGHKR
jgi:two-component system chemotaxis response regulator CheY